MELILAILGIATLAWGVVYARFGSLVVGATVFIMGGYVLTRDFWQADIGPLPLTIDRLLIAGLVMLFGWRWWRGQLNLRPAHRCRLGWVLVCWVPHPAVCVYRFTRKRSLERAAVMAVDRQLLDAGGLVHCCSQR